MGGPPVLTPAEREDVERRLFDLVVERRLDSRLFDLSARRIPDSPNLQTPRK
jgi:hypothetical protein